ncbi:dCTP deaminase [Curtobacterium sp. 20TX0008]|uniref:dCTP deaminase n=1 Tax=Curtobacterium sp. 20TX0008 TaxID=3022018 RepID=UPI002330B618|nr:dCTP deaminase [Curtobacterium sp. 20TX0008]MDB6427092.1 dCTP deaminase [Curtobacterium sp. 20TX0008]
METQRALLGGDGTGAHLALRLFLDYCDLVEVEITESFDTAPSDATRLGQIRHWSNHVRTRVRLFDAQFRRGRGEVPAPVVDLVESELTSMGLPDVRAVVSVGIPGNFLTWTDFVRSLFNGLSDPAARDRTPMVVITAPDMEGSQASWIPIVTGHELAHYLQRHRPISRSHPNQFTEWDVAALPVNPHSTHVELARELNQIAASWLEELTCDAYAVHRYGAAAVVALTDFLHYVGPVSIPGESHPHRALRTRLMFRWLDGTTGGDTLRIAGVARPMTVQDRPLPAWAQLLEKHFEAVAASIWDDVTAWSPHTTYTQATASDTIEDCAEQLLAGHPAIARERAPHRGDPVSEPDLVNAIWLAFRSSTDVPLNRMALKSLDLLGFLHRWHAAGGGHQPPAAAATPSPTPFGALSAAELTHRLGVTDDTRLQVIPRLPPAVTAASIDLRLGNEFIVFERSSLGEFDALDDAQDPRAIQKRVSRAWGDTFFLHPGQLVLAATLEYLMLPDDLVGQVITRSSYGRLGLLSATAVEVHPGFRGCLTLELVNLGELPMAIAPGERIAQLMLWHTAPPAAGAGTTAAKYSYPIGPEFSKIRSDTEAETLRRMRQAHAAR